MFQEATRYLERYSCFNFPVAVWNPWRPCLVDLIHYSIFQQERVWWKFRMNNPVDVNFGLYRNMCTYRVIRCKVALVIHIQCILGKKKQQLKANQVKELRASRTTVTFRKSPCGLYSDLSLFPPFLFLLSPLSLVLTFWLPFSTDHFP